MFAKVNNLEAQFYYIQHLFYPMKNGIYSGLIALFFKNELVLPSQKFSAMALKTFVKISGVNNLSDARYCAGMGVNQIGFNIEENHPNYTDPQSFKELSDWVSGVDFVGEIESVEAAGRVAEIIENYELQALQVSSIELIQEALNTGKEVIFYSNSVEKAQQVISEFGSSLSYILLESDDEASVAELSKSADIVIASGFDADNLDEVLNTVKPKGIALKGGDEIRPGFKDFDEMADILEALDADEWI